MQIGKLDHVNIRTTQLDVMIDWYTKILGMHIGDRPDFPFSGAWMYTGNTAAVHLVSIEGASGTGSEVELKLEHFAFSATGRIEFEAKLQSLNKEFHRFDVPEVNIIQVNIWDPDGNHIHIDFPAEE